MFETIRNDILEFKENINSLEFSHQINTWETFREQISEAYNNEDIDDAEYDELRDILDEIDCVYFGGSY